MRLYCLKLRSIDMARDGAYAKSALTGRKARLNSVAHAFSRCDRDLILRAAASEPARLIAMSVSLSSYSVSRSTPAGDRSLAVCTGLLSLRHTF